MDLNQVYESWQTFLIEVTFAKNYKIPYILTASRPVPNNPVLDNLLPSLLIVKLTSLVEEALGEYIAQKGLVVPSQYRADLNGRINFLRDNGHLKDAGKLHTLRKLRNKLAHKFIGNATWEELDLGVNAADDELQHLGFIGTRPTLEIDSERLPVDPVDPKYLASIKYRVALKSNRQKVAEFTWSTNIARSSAG